MAEYNNRNFKRLVNRLDQAHIKGESDEIIAILKENIAKKIIKKSELYSNLDSPENIHKKAAFLEQQIHFSMDILHSDKIAAIMNKINEKSKENMLQFDDLVEYPHIERYKDFFNSRHISEIKKEVRTWNYEHFIKGLKTLIAIDDQNNAFYGLSDKYFDIILNLYHSFEDKTDKSNRKEMLWYQPTPIRTLKNILDNIDSWETNDVFYDIWSGFWRTGFFCEIYKWMINKSVEYNKELCDFGKNIIQDLKLKKSHIINDNAVNVEYRDGTIFYFFNSFVWSLFENLMDKLKEIAKTRKIMICWLFTPQLNTYDWLKCTHKELDDDNETYWMFIYESTLHT